MNRREFLFFRKAGHDQTAELSCEQLYMRYLDSTVDGTTAQLFETIGQSLSAVTVLRLTDAAWLTCEELRPLESLLAEFRSRGGRLE